MAEKDLRENPFRDEIFNYFLAHGYSQSKRSDYDIANALDTAKLFEFLEASQPKELDKLKATDRRTRDVAVMPMMPQFRTTAHIKGDYSLKVADAYRHFDDSVAAICDFDRNKRCKQRNHHQEFLPAIGIQLQNPDII